MVDQRGGNIRVLHVDDDATFLDLVSTHLTHASDRFEVETESDPTETLAAIRESSPDCIVSDYEMPRLDGLELLRAVREDHPDLPFVLFTGKGSEQIAGEAISAGVTDYLQKGGGTEKFELLANRVENAVEAHRVESAFDHQHEKLTALFESSPDAIVEYRVVDDEAIVETVNPAFARTFGCDRDAIVGERLDDIIVPEDRRDAARTLNRRAEDEGLLRTEVHRLTPEGSRDFLLTSIPLPSAQGGYAVYTDVSEARERERRLDTLVDNVPGMVYRREPDRPWQMEFVGGNCQRLTGYTPEHIETGSVRWDDDLVHPEDRGSVTAAVEAALAEDESFEVTYRIKPREGDQRWCWERGQAVLDADGSPGGVEGFVTDITDYREMVAALREARALLAGKDVDADLSPVRSEFDRLLESVRIAPERLAVDYER
jgi:PAS domain S-box-containing protein